MKTAVITGATKGMGKAIAEKFLLEGFTIFICARTSADLAAVKKEWEFSYPKREVLSMTVDMADKEQVKAFGTAVNKAFPEGVDVLVNNAGLFFPGNLADEPEGRLEELMSTHVFGVYHLTRSLLPNMIENKSGHIFNISSIAALQAYPGGGSYSIAKNAIKGFTENLRYELRDKGIKVTSITPGAVWTDSWKNSGVAEDRLMEAEDIAKMIWAAYDLSPKANVENIIMRPQLGDL